MIMKPDLPITAVIVDDEPLARQKLRRLVSADKRISIVAEAANGDEAINAIRDHAPGVVFLDIEMPGANGFDVINEVSAESMPAVVFVTAFDQYAIEAFRVHAVDYLLKPLDPHLVASVLDRIAERHEQRAAVRWSTQLRALLDSVGVSPPNALPPATRYVDRFAVRTKGRMFFVRTEALDWIEAADNYIRLHSGGQSHILRERISNIEQRLDPEQFLRIHRSTIVNVDSIRELQPWTSGEMVVLMNDGARLKLSRSYRDRLVRRIGSTEE